MPKVHYAHIWQETLDAGPRPAIGLGNQPENGDRADHARGGYPEQQFETTTGHDGYWPVPNTRRTSSRPATSASMSSRVE